MLLEAIFMFTFNKFFGDLSLRKLKDDIRYINSLSLDTQFMCQAGGSITLQMQIQMISGLVVVD